MNDNDTHSEYPDVSAFGSAHADKITASEKAAAVVPLKPALDDFESWWHDEGSDMAPLPGEDAEAHVHRVCRIAWSNGAFKADASAPSLLSAAKDALESLLRLPDAESAYRVTCIQQLRAAIAATESNP